MMSHRVIMILLLLLVSVVLATDPPAPNRGILKALKEDFQFPTFNSANDKAARTQAKEQAAERAAKNANAAAVTGTTDEAAAKAAKEAQEKAAVEAQEKAANKYAVNPEKTKKLVKHSNEEILARTQARNANAAKERAANKAAKKAGKKATKEKTDDAVALGFGKRFSDLLTKFKTRSSDLYNRVFGTATTKAATTEAAETAATKTATTEAAEIAATKTATAAAAKTAANEVVVPEVVELGAKKGAAAASSNKLTVKGAEAVTKEVSEKATAEAAEQGLKKGATEGLETGAKQGFFARWGAKRAAKKAAKEAAEEAAKRTVIIDGVEYLGKQLPTKGFMGAINKASWKDGIEIIGKKSATGVTKKGFTWAGLKQGHLGVKGLGSALALGALGLEVWNEHQQAKKAQKSMVKSWGEYSEEVNKVNEGYVNSGNQEAVPPAQRRRFRG